MWSQNPYDLLAEVPEKDRDKVECISIRRSMFSYATTAGIIPDPPKIVSLSEFENLLNQNLETPKQTLSSNPAKKSIKEYSIIPFTKAIVRCGRCGFSWKEAKNLPTSKCNNCGNIITW